MSRDSNRDSHPGAASGAPPAAGSRDPKPAGEGLPRRAFVAGLLFGASSYAFARTPRQQGEGAGEALAGSATPLAEPRPGEDLLRYVERIAGGFDFGLYRRVLGAANEFKEGDAAQGLAAPDEGSRRHARALLARTRIADLLAHPVFEDEVSAYIAGAVDAEVESRIAGWTMGELKEFLLAREPAEIAAILPGIPSDVAAFTVKLLSNDELIAVSRRIWNPLPGSKIGAEGYLGARIQPNSPTDDLEDIVWQVFDGWSYAVGDVVLGTNPVSSDVESVAAIERALAEVVATFGLEDVIPQCVLAHIDVQAEAERRYPGSTALWFQSLAGVEDANVTFDISVDKMTAHAATRSGRYGLYFETGQGADSTNGHGKGFDMVIHEARKYGFARALAREVAAAQRRAGRAPAAWVHLNDVAGFIGPEVFRSREQLVRCCLEDTVMGKLHGLTIGLDVCSTLHMEIDLDDLDWCLDQIMPANPAYLMALPTKNDPMLSYLTTGFQDHVRIRERFGYQVDDRMWAFFQELGVIDAEGRPTERFGRPAWVYLEYRRRKGDRRTEAEILTEGARTIAAIRRRGVEIAEGHGEHLWDLEPQLESRIRYLYDDSKTCIWAELPTGFASALPGAVTVRTLSADRTDYILHPPTGERLAPPGVRAIERLRDSRLETGSSRGGDDVQIVVSDGLNALALTDPGHLEPYLERVRRELAAAGLALAPEPIVVVGGRVRAGYRIGEILYGRLPERDARRAILHIIGERPGSGHHAYSVYITAAQIAVWADAGRADHNITRVVSGIADTALDPERAAVETVRILRQQARPA
ncbi:MAG TPA: ethanolamine ammonia-lyase subunit EutB [Thermoanaerobaculia bacterium]|nr:ethanolamine ammonia-lyase subunit EutB [Thermoanaerobaculia bacterium]